MNRDEILDTANSLINGDRQEEYGDIRDNFKVIAWMWQSYLCGRNPQRDGDVFVTAADVAHMMVLLKLCRYLSGKPGPDTWIDMCGYAAIAGELCDGDQKRDD